mgnify:CR=1 FL=1
MNLNRSRRSRKRDAQERIFVLLIVLVVSLYFVDRFIGLEGIFTRPRPTETPLPSQTPTVSLIYEPADEYSFLEATRPLPTNTPQPTPTNTPTPYLPMEYVQIADELEVDRSQPLTVIGLCEEPFKSNRYVAFDPHSGSYRNLTDSIPYLEQPMDPDSLALYDGLSQRGLPVDFLSEFPFPREWRWDMQYRILAISANADAVVVHRWQSEVEELFWLSRGSDNLVELMSLPNSIEESYTDANNLWLFLRLLNENGESDLYAVDLVTGAMVSLTEFQEEDAFDGVLSWDGEYFSYWTREGIWVVKLDGSFGALAFPGAEQPAWSPDDEQMVMIKDGRLAIGKMDVLDGSGVLLIGLPVNGRQPEWSPDGSYILYWQPKGADCTLNFWNVAGSFSTEVFRTQNQVCQSLEQPLWSPNGDSVLVNLPSTGDSNQASGDIICNLQTGQCQYLRAYAGNYPCRRGVWSESTFPYRWDFDASSDGWYIIHYLDSLTASNGSLFTRSRGLTPVMNSPKNLNINADVYPFIEITMRVNGGTEAEINFVTDEDPMLKWQRLFAFDLIPDGEMHRYVIDLRGFSWWDGTVKYLRFRPVNAGLVNIEIQSFRILSEVEELD